MAIDADYQKKVAKQIEQYADTIDIHALPDIFHTWSGNFIAPGLQEVFGTSSIDDIYALAYIEARASLEQTEGRILSIGCGDGTVELHVAEILLSKGVRNFQLVCADLSPILLDRLREAAQRRQLQQYLQPQEADLNAINIRGDFDMIMANHSLHHIVELEHLFKYSYEHLKASGIFATCDMIGRNGHMRWPEIIPFIDAIWPLLSEKQRTNVQLRRLYKKFEDHDCSTEGFEGIRAQDVLPTILGASFYPYKFFGAGGLIDIFVDRGFGPGFDAKNENDVRMIYSICQMSDAILDAGISTPTWMMAYFTKDARAEKFYRNRSALSSLRENLRQTSINSTTKDNQRTLSSTLLNIPFNVFRRRR